MARHYSKNKADSNYGGRFGNRPTVVSELKRQAFGQSKKQKISDKLKGAPFGTKIGIITNTAGNQVLVPYRDFIYHTMRKKGRIPMELEEALRVPGIQENEEVSVALRDAVMKLRGIGLNVWVGLKKKHGVIKDDDIVIMTDEQALRTC